jgi:predicted nuclease of predicted toxin-antitoxin system
LPEPTPRLLFDENISARLVEVLASIYPGSIHVRDIGLAPVSDRVIREYARERALVIVTKDEDFHRMTVLQGGPPKVIWIRLRNCSTEDIIRLLSERRSEIGNFVTHEEALFLALA